MSDDQAVIWRNVFALSLMTLCYAAFQGMCQTIVPLAMEHHGFTKATIGLILAVPGIIVLSLGAPLARLANGRWRRDENNLSGGIQHCSRETSPTGPTVKRQVLHPSTNVDNDSVPIVG